MGVLDWLKKKSDSQPPNPTGVAPAALGLSLGLDLYARLRTEPGNLLFSPASLWLAFALAYGGARKQTASQIERVFGFEADSHDVAGRILGSWKKAGSSGVELRVANRLFGQKGYDLEKLFRSLAAKTYGAPLELLDFSASPERGRESINAWVESHTKRRICDLLPPGTINADTRLVLVNAIYFLGKWASPFDPGETRDEPFHESPVKTTTVPMMRQTGRFRYAVNASVQLLEMDYVGHDLAMTILLPQERDGLAALEGQVDAEIVNGWLSDAQMCEVQVTLPRWETDGSTLPLSEHLGAMGIQDAFSRDHADFSGIANRPTSDDTLFLTEAFHRAFIKVDESGTEAAAATGLMLELGIVDVDVKTPVFRADHPFMFLIRDRRSNAALFLGRVVDPA